MAYQLSNRDARKLGFEVVCSWKWRIILAAAFGVTAYLIVR